MHILRRTPWHGRDEKRYLRLTVDRHWAVENCSLHFSTGQCWRLTLRSTSMSMRRLLNKKDVFLNFKVDNFFFFYFLRYFWIHTLNKCLCKMYLEISKFWKKYNFVFKITHFHFYGWRLQSTSTSWKMQFVDSQCMSTCRRPFLVRFSSRPMTFPYFNINEGLRNLRMTTNFLLLEW